MYEDMNLGELAALAVEIRERKRALDAQSKAAAAELDSVKAEIHGRLVSQDLDRIAVNGVTLSRSSTTYPQVTDWEAVHEYILENRALNLLQRRVTTSLWQELLEGGEVIPGIEAFEKTDVNIRAIN